MKITKLSKKQKQIFNFIKSDDYALICDGSVRSGKTMAMSVAFVLWAMANFDRCNFAICGKTVQSVERNVLKPLQEVEGLPVRMEYKISSKLLTVYCGDRKNWFYLFGGRDESSYMLIQGITLAGTLFDEVALMPQSFVEQAMARSASFENPKFWFNCNPGSPYHYFYQDWIENQKEGTQHIHFLLEDNPIMTEKMISRTKAMYSGVFYQRYILGLWVIAEGIIYDMFDEARHMMDKAPEMEGPWYIASDFGIQNTNVWTKVRKIKDDGSRWYIADVSAYSGRDEKKQKTVQELADDLDKLMDGEKPKFVIIDPSAAAMKVELRKRGYRVKDADNDVLNGISDVQTMLQEDRLLINSKCEIAKQELHSYAWDPKAAERGEDKPLKVNDHFADSLRYFVRTMKLVKRGDKATSPDRFKSYLE